jgi:cation diffusion facilitator CzcD-associated flavoprotein CzcO
MSNEDSAETLAALEAAKAKYAEERAKRLRADGADQWQDFSGEYKDFDRDPYVEPGFTRDALTEEVEVVIVGAGFGGMLAAAQLRQQGIDNFRIIDKAGDFGGTWYWNRYPGAMCDVESYCYLPMLEETGYMPTQKYAQAPEIFAYCQLFGRHFGIYDNALFQTEVSGMEWNEDSQRWVTTTSRGDTITSKFTVIVGGVLHKAKLPAIPGIKNFKGEGFHTSRWDYEYTGGNAYGGMTNLADKRVGVIGTGATAVQVVPKLAADCKELFVFQRTPAAVGVRNQGDTDVEWFKSLKPGWQIERIRNFTEAVSGKQPEVNLVGDSWTEMYWTDTKQLGATPEEQLALEELDFQNMEKIRHRIADIIEDPETAERMQPWYGQYCKRLCFHDDYLPAFNRPNVHLVDTEGRGVDHITENAVVVDGVEYPVDLLIYASGFEVTSDYHHRLGFDPKGRDGVSLSEAWGDGPYTLHGVMSDGFPNMLMISTLQGGFGTNFVHYLTETSKHVVFIIKMCLDEGISQIEPTRDAEEGWFMELLSHVMGMANYNTTCTPGYMNREGEAGDMKAARGLSYMGSVGDYAKHLENWREEGKLTGVEVVRSK